MGGDILRQPMPEKGWSRTVRANGEQESLKVSMAYPQVK